MIRLGPCAGAGISDALLRVLDEDEHVFLRVVQLAANVPTARERRRRPGS